MATTAVVSAGADPRYAHLLEPLRDLAENWKIDIATELTDYLGELDRMVVSLDGGVTSLNFAEAALLIQGSACIYSKKVEHLHSLVFQTLNCILSSPRKQTAGSEEAEVEDVDVELRRDAQEDFLVLDDTLEEATNVFLNDDQSDVVGNAMLSKTPFLPAISFDEGAAHLNLNLSLSKNPCVGGAHAQFLERHGR